MKRETKTHLFFLGLFLVITLFSFHDYVSSSMLRIRGDMALQAHAFKNVRDSILVYHQFPHWTVNYFAGNPLFANSQPIVFSYTTILDLMLPTVAALNFSIILNVILSGFFMYLLMVNLSVKPKYAFLSALVYSFNSYAIPQLRSGQIERGIVYAWVPLAFLFCLKAVRTREWVKYSILVGVVFSIQFLGGGTEILLLFFLMIGAFFIYELFGKKVKRRALKIALVCIIAGVVFFGLIAIKFFPLVEFSEKSSKGITGKFSFEDSVGQKVKIKNVWDVFKLPLYANLNRSARIGIIAYILMLLSLFFFRKRIVMFLWIFIILTVLIAVGSPLYYLIWKFVPTFDRLHHIARIMFLFGFCSAILAGFGASWLFGKLEEKYKVKKGALNIIYIIMIAFMLTELLVFDPPNYAKIEKKYGENFMEFLKPLGYKNYGLDYDMVIRDFQTLNFDDTIMKNELYNYIKEDKDMFRINNIESRMLGGFSALYATYNNLQVLYGGTSIWIPEYFNVYLGYSHSDPAKFYGMLNTKYIYSNITINNSDLEFVKEFERCKTCITDYAADISIDGPYLYKNKKYLPRAYSADYSVLVIGNREDALSAGYSLMLENSFDPSNTVIIMAAGRSVNDYSQEFLNRFSLIILLGGSINENSETKLRNYVNSGGKILPDLFGGKNTISAEEINGIFSSFKGDYSKVKKTDISYYSPNKVILDAKPGFLVLSEKFFMFEGWKAKMNSEKKEILRANGINSAVYIDKPGELVIYYSSKSFKTGLLISLFTLISIAGYFGYGFVKKRVRKDEQTN